MTCRPDALVFDFDGVIADTEPLHLRAFQEVLGERGLSLVEADYFARYLGLNDREGFAAVARDHGQRLSSADVDTMIATKTLRFQALVAIAPVVYPGVAARVREWDARVPVAIASGALRAEIELILEAVGIRGCFPVIVSADDPVSSKPSPDPFRRALTEVERSARWASAGRRLDPSRCVAIEDSRWGIEAAKGAGMRVVGVSTSYPAEELRAADVVIGATAELTEDVVAAALSCRS